MLSKEKMDQAKKTPTVDAKELIPYPNINWTLGILTPILESSNTLPAFISTVETDFICNNQNRTLVKKNRRKGKTNNLLIFFSILQ